MADPATLTTWLDKLEKSRASGILTVEYDGRRITYRSDSELAAEIASIKRQLGGQRVHTVLFETSKGLS